MGRFYLAKASEDEVTLTHGILWRSVDEYAAS
jgi:hypothetical protein